MDQIINKLSVIDFSFILIIVAKILLLVVLYQVVKKYKPAWLMPVRVLACVMIMRVILFENPLAWYIYNHTLDPEVVGWRQSSVLYDNFNQFKSNQEVEFLAVGSSQTGAIYDVSVDSVASKLQVKSLAGLGPVDLYMYRENIVESNPENVLLFLSEFDMGRYPSLEAIKLSPNLGLKFPEIFMRIREDFPGDETNNILKEMFFGEIFPEYKYSYIFKGYLDQFTGKQVVMPNLESQVDDDNYFENQLSQLKVAVQEENLEINFRYLNDFISYLSDHDINVLVIEGQYHPFGYSNKNLALQEKVRSQLTDLQAQYSNLTYVPKTETIIFTIDDYDDAYHVNKQAAAKFTRSVINSLDKFGTGTH
ncbi:hypothetical protein AB2B38_008070 [Balneola sp. MJW-20]|uniref:hypothetical protein n=1 Tax=Gracilimonas aurantiaca TaxID=3234185 RepID=UPI0034666D40